METFTDDTIVALASFLSPHDMLSLALTCKRFGDKHGTKTSRSRRLAAREANKSRGSGREVRQRTEPISLMEVAARTVLQTKWTDEEKNALPRREDESWIGIYQEFLKLFRLPLQFDKLAGNNMDYVDGSTDKSKVCSNFQWGVSGSAICTNIMRAGKHYVSFQVSDGDSSANFGIIIGVMRPTTNDITSKKSCHPADNLSRFSLNDYEILHRNNIDCCLLNTHNGNGIIRSRWKRWETPDEECKSFNWEGMEPTHERSYKIGFALDLDEGTLDVYKNDRRLGTMKSGLVGEYCWVASLLSFDDEASVTIGR